ncbi:MAG: response regulator [bacterium]
MIPKIACVDDEKAIHEMVRAMMEPASKAAPINLFDPSHTESGKNEADPKYNLNFFDNAISARRALEEEYSKEDPFHLLIVDLRMPERDGLWLIEQARNIDPRIRIIVFTALSEVTLETISEKAGNPNFMYLEKSANPLVLIQAVENEIANWITLYDNRRIHQRLPLEQRVTFTIPGKMEGQVIDISSEGIGILDLPMEIAVGKKVDFTFEDEQTSAAGKVK